MNTEKKKSSVWVGVGAFFSLLVLSFLLLMTVGLWVSKRQHFGPEKIALVRVEGLIGNSKHVLEQLKNYTENDTVKAIVLRVDSPGGGVAPSQEIYQAVKKITGEGKQKVVVSMGGVAASGGYYIACAADNIVANPGTITGSIGVLMEFANVEELFKKVGLKTVVMKKGLHKDIGSPVRDMTKEEKAIIQELLDDVYNQFVNAIAEGRGLELSQVKAIADGRIFSGRKAKELGLVDQLGNLPQSFEVAAEMAGITQRPLVILEEEEEYPLSRILDGALKLINPKTLSQNWPETGFSLQYR